MSSREFTELVRAIGDCKSKQEEDSIIKREVVTLRTRLNERDAQGRMRELCMRMMYCEMLGHPVEFGYIHAVNMTQRTVLAEKKTGYLASSLFLDSDSELLILLVNTLQRDLRSSNPWEVCAALAAATKLIGADTVPAVIKLVKDVFAHQDAHVRKKALMVLHRFMSTSPEAVSDCLDQFKRALTDRDPSVMAAGLNGLFELSRADPRSYAGLVPSLVSILKQVPPLPRPRTPVAPATLRNSSFGEWGIRDVPPPALARRAPRAARAGGGAPPPPGSPPSPTPRAQRAASQRAPPSSGGGAPAPSRLRLPQDARALAPGPSQPGPAAPAPTRGAERAL